MTKQTIEVEVPDGMDVGRVVTLNHTGFAPDGGRLEELICHVSLLPAWTYPEWLGGAGVRRDDSGVWYAFQSVSATWMPDGSWMSDGWKFRIDNDAFPLWTPPPCTDWRESWHPNPRWDG